MQEKKKSFKKKKLAQEIGIGQENTLSTKKASKKKRTYSRKKDNAKNSNQETTLSVKKIKKRFNIKRQRSRKENFKNFFFS